MARPPGSAGRRPATPAHAGYYNTVLQVPHQAPDAFGQRLIIRDLGQVATGHADIGMGGIVVNAPPLTLVMRKHRLDSSLDLVEGAYDAELDGAVWSGVGCKLKYNSQGEPFLRLDIAYDAAPGVGACVLDLVNGGTHTVAVTLTR